MNVVELRDVCRVFGTEPAVHALSGVDLNIRQGDFVAITGPSGSGKSTLLSILGLLDSPTSGTYRLDGDDAATMTPRQRAAVRGDRIGFVFQSFHLLGHRTVLDNVALAGMYTETPARRRRARALDALERVDMTHRLAATPVTLSGGERQRVAIARALASQPSILLCDEPTGNLDSNNADNVLRLLRGLNESGLTVVMITHDQGIAAHATSHVSIRDGRLCHGIQLVGAGGAR